jgi:hypothetical protein
MLISVVLTNPRKKAPLRVAVKPVISRDFIVWLASTTTLPEFTLKTTSSVDAGFVVPLVDPSAFKVQVASVFQLPPPETGYFVAKSLSSY